jgi:4-coumarate--CoA ligase
MSPIDPFTTQSTFPAITIPEADLWTFLFERKTAFLSDKGATSTVPQSPQFSVATVSVPCTCSVIFHDALTSRSYTFHEIKETAIAFGNALRAEWNWQKGNVLRVASTNCIDTPPLIFGTQWANGVISPSNPVLGG